MIWKVRLFCSIVRAGTKKSWVFPWFVKVDHCAVGSRHVVLKVFNFGCKIFMSFEVTMLMMSDSTTESIEKSISRSGA